MTCNYCEQAEKENHGLYRMQCLSCCVRLVVSARPSRAHQEAMLAAIARYLDAPSKNEIINGVKKWDQKKENLAKL